MERVAIFIDGSNFYHGLKNWIGKANINFEKLSKLLCDPRTLLRTYYYNVRLPQELNPTQYQDQQKFFEALERTPYQQSNLDALKKEAPPTSKRAWTFE